MLRNKLLAVAALIAGLLLPAQAMAAYEAFTRADLNLRLGPDVTYGVIDVIPYGEPVIVLGCLEAYYWCDVDWFGLRGWVAAEYLVQPGTSVYLPHVAPQLALPVIVFSFHSYHDRHYHDRPWYKKRHGRWRGRDWSSKRKRDRDRHWDRDDGDRHWDGDKADQPRKRIKRARKHQEIQQPSQQRQVKRTPDRRKVRRAPERRKLEISPQQRQIKRTPDRRKATRAPERRSIERSPQKRQIKRSKRSESSGHGQQRSKKRSSRRGDDEQPRRRRR